MGTFLEGFLIASLWDIREGLMPKEEPSRFNTFVFRVQTNFGSIAWRSINPKVLVFENWSPQT